MASIRFIQQNLRVPNTAGSCQHRGIHSKPFAKLLIPITSLILCSYLEIIMLSPCSYAKPELVEDPVPLSPRAEESVPSRPSYNTHRVSTSCDQGYMPNRETGLELKSRPSQK